MINEQHIVFSSGKRPATVSSNNHYFIFCLSQSFGGLEQVILRDAELLVELGCSVTCVSVDGSTFFAQSKHLNTITVSSNCGHHFDLKNLLHLRKKIKLDLNPVFILHEPSRIVFIRTLQLLYKKKPKLFIFRHIWNNHSKKSIWFKWLYLGSENLFSTSESAKKNILETHNINSTKVKVFPYSIKNNFFKFHFLEKLNVSKIGILGRIDPAKGQEFLIHALRGTSYDIKIMGGYTPGLSEDFKSRMRKLFLTHNITVNEFHSNPANFLRSIDVLVVPSDEEAFGLVAIEAMAVGTPVLMSKAGSYIDIVAENRGYYYTSKDPVDLLKKLNYMKNNLEEVNLKSKIAFDWVRQHHTEEIRVRHYKNYILKL